jgi:hypothetical protein
LFLDSASAVAILSPLFCHDNLEEVAVKRDFFCILSAAVFCLYLAPSAHADLRVKSKYTASGQSSEISVYSRGSRQRFEPGAGIAIINQNDVKRTVQIFDDKKMYMVVSPDMITRALPTESQPTAPSSTAKGGVVNVTLAVTDTGERKQMFGYAARHVKTTMTIAAGADACTPGNETIETDGWYIDYTPEDASTPSGPVPAQPSTSTCKDDVQVNQTGAGSVGYPLAYTVKTSRDGKSTEVTMETLEFSASPLNASLFEVPMGYTELKGFAEMSTMFNGSAAAAAGGARPATPEVVAPKAAGATRVGVADIGNRAGKDLGGGSPRDQLVSELLNNKVDAVSLMGATAAEIEAAAKKLEADYILYTDVAEVKKAGGGGLGGLVSKASSITGGGNKLEAKLDYRLTPIDGSKPLLAASAKGTNGGGGGLGGLTSPFGLANLASFGMLSRMGMFNPNMMRLFGNMGAGGMGGMGAMMKVPGMPRGGLDPGLSPFMATMGATQAAMAPPVPTEDGKAVIDAFSDTAKKIAEALNKKKK